MKFKYEEWRPNAATRRIIALVEAVCREWVDQGYDLTLRQLYYRFVAGDLFPDDRRWAWTSQGWKRHPAGTKNAEPNYKWLGDIVNKARLAGMLDWDYIVDRTRALRGTSHWREPSSIVRAAANSYRLDKWRNQARRVEVWVEKDALAGVVQRVADEYDLDWFSCRGYVSQSEQRVAAQRFLGYLRGRQGITVLHLGDHDPSGIDMTRDIRDRITNFLLNDWLHEFGDDFAGDVVPGRKILDHMIEWTGEETPIVINRIALNMDQIRQYDPPPNPAKMTDSRAGGYVDEHGHESWELDALPPDVLADLIRTEVTALVSDHLDYERIEARETRERELLSRVAGRWSEIAALVRGS